MLQDDRIDAIFRVNAVGRIRGVTFIDHEEGIVANGSVLGKEFSANMFNELYPQQNPEERQQTEQQNDRRQEGLRFVNTPLPPIIDSILSLADAQAYKEQQEQIRKRRKRKLRSKL